MKNSTLFISLLLSITLCFISCGDEDIKDAGKKELIIIPGQGFENLKIGDPGSKVKPELGDGFETIVNVGGSGNATYNYFNDSKGIDIIFGQYGSGDLDINSLPIKSFYLFDNFDGKTKEGIKIGSTKTEVVAAYGEPDEMDMWVNVYYTGMLITYDEMDMVQDITILKI